MCDRWLFPVVVAFVVAGCGGGSGSGNLKPSGGVDDGGSGSSTPPFTAFSAVQANETLQASGMRQSVTAESGTLVKGSAESVAVDFTFDGSRRLSAIEVGSGSASTSFAVDCRGSACTLSNGGGTVGRLADPNGPGWDYQTYGYWIVPEGAGGRTASALSAGSATTSSGIPVSGTAQYAGASGGIYVDPTGVTYEHNADMHAVADFSARSVSLATANTHIVPVAGGSAAAAPELNLSGNLVIGANQFSGSILTAGGMTGTAAGRFYGPQAQEMGGVFECNCSGGLEFLTGAFGGRQVPAAN